MFLNYLALIMILIVLVILFYTFIFIHELPYEAAKHIRSNHPQQDAIYVACWLSLFTLHAIWPLSSDWALSHKEPAPNSTTDVDGQIQGTNSRLAQIENRLRRLEQNESVSKKLGAS